jgi:hypothetical protein
MKLISMPRDFPLGSGCGTNGGSRSGPQLEAAAPKAVPPFVRGWGEKRTALAEPLKRHGSKRG